MRRNNKNNNKKRRNSKKSTRSVANRPDSNKNTVVTDKPTINLNERNLYKKFSIYGTSVQGVTNTGIYYSLAGAIGQGTASTARIGDIVFINRCDLRLSIQAGDTNNQVRAILLYSVEPVITSPYDYLDNGPSAAYDILSYWKPYLDGNVINVLYDKTWTLTDGAETQYVHEEISIPINKRIVYAFGTNTPLSGALYLMFFSDSGLAPHPQVNLNPRWWFRDL